MDVGELSIVVDELSIVVDELSIILNRFYMDVGELSIMTESDAGSDHLWHRKCVGFPAVPGGSVSKKQPL